MFLFGRYTTRTYNCMPGCWTGWRVNCDTFKWPVSCSFLTLNLLVVGTAVSMSMVHMHVNFTSYAATSNYEIQGTVLWLNCHLYKSKIFVECPPSVIEVGSMFWESAHTLVATTCVHFRFWQCLRELFRLKKFSVTDSTLRITINIKPDIWTSHPLHQLFCFSSGSPKYIFFSVSLCNIQFLHV
jgi:hypothetical protein